MTTSLRAFRRFDPSVLVWVAAVAIVGFLVLNPMGWLVSESFRDQTGAPTVGNYVAAFTDPSLIEPAANSLRLGVMVAVFSLLLAAPAAWAVARTNMPLRRTMRILILATFATPGYLGALAWVLLASPRAGMINTLFRTLTGYEGTLFDIYSWPGIVLVSTLYTYPLAFLLLNVALSAIPSDMEEAANVLGAGTVRTGFTVTLPLLLPAIMGASLLAFLDGVSDFGIPAVLGTPIGIQVLSTRIYRFFQFPFNRGAGAALGILLLVVTGIILLVQRRVLGRRSYVTLTGKSGAQRRIDMGRWRYVLVGYCIGLVTLSLVLPYLVVIQASLSRAWSQGWTWANFTLDNYRFVLVDFDLSRVSIVNSLKVSLVAATLAVVIAGAAAFVSARQLVRGHQVIAFAVVAPFVLPAIVLAVGVFFAYSRPPFFLYGTLLALIVAYVTKALPIAFVQSRAAILGVHPELEEAARVLGASSVRSFWDVTVPLVRPGLVGAWIVVLVLSLRELSSAIFLYTARTQVIGVTILNFTNEGNIEWAAVMGVAMLAATFLVLVVGYRLVGRNVLEVGS